MINRLLGLTSVAFISMIAAAAPASAAITYMTGFSDPWNNTTNDNAMDTAFGAGNWTKYNGFDASVFSGSKGFVFLDGSDSNGQDFASFLTTNAASITSFVNGGGSVFANMATNVGPDALSGPFGTSYSYPQFSSIASLTAAGLAGGLDANGAGTSWTGTYFSHDTVSGGTCYVTGSNGCVFAGGKQGLGGYYVGGQTTANFHSAGGDQLLVNELTFASKLGGSAVPEPATWAMMIGGVGVAGGAMRRRRGNVRTTLRYA